MPLTRLSCILWRLFSSSGHFAIIPRYHSCKDESFWLMIHTYSLVFSFVFHLFFHTVSLFDSVMFDSSFLLLISSWSPGFDPNLIMFLHSTSGSISFLSMVIFSVLSSLTSRFLFVSMAFTFWDIFKFFRSNSVMKWQYQHAPFLVEGYFRPVSIYVSNVYWFFSYLFS